MGTVLKKRAYGVIPILECHFFFFANISNFGINLLINIFLYLGLISYEKHLKVELVDQGYEH